MRQVTEEKVHGTRIVTATLRICGVSTANVSRGRYSVSAKKTHTAESSVREKREKSQN